MAALTKHLLSQVAAISSRRFIVTSTVASACNVFHVAPSVDGQLDEMWVYAHNFGTSDVAVTFMMGLTSYPETRLADVHEGVEITIPFQSGRALVFDGTLISHSLSAAVYADTANVVSLDGFVNRIIT